MLYQCPPIISNSEMEQFISLYREVTQPVIASIKESVSTGMTAEVDWIVNVLEKNVLHGSSYFFGLLTCTAYKTFATEEPLPDNFRMAMILGWCMEMVRLLATQLLKVYICQYVTVLQ